MAYSEPDALSCKHFQVNEQIKQSLHRITDHASKIPSKCTVCRTSRNVWCCLDCFHIGCGRYEKKHALEHAQSTQHYICVNMESPRHLWCYKCDQGIVYFEGSDSPNTNSSRSASQSQSSVNSSRSQSQSQSQSTTSSPSASTSRLQNGRSVLSLSPTKWKPAQSILKSTLIWTNSMNGGLCGMQNLGNTCFMSASLQALLHCPAVIYLFTLPEVAYVKRYNRVRLVDEFIKLTYALWEGKHRSLIPRDILRCVMYKFPQFRGYGQQDAHEFLTCLLQFLHDQYKYKIPVHDKEDKHSDEHKQAQNPTDDADGDEDDDEEEDKNEDDDDDDDDDEEDNSDNQDEQKNGHVKGKGKGKKKQQKRKESHTRHKKYEETSIIYDLFAGEIISQVECCECGNKSRKKEQLTCIQVEIPKQEQMERAVKERNAKPLPAKGWMQSVFTFVGLQSQSIPLSLCLHSYCTSEDLQHTEQYHCEKCKCKQDAKKTLLLSRLPEVLIIQIKRFSHDSFWRGSSKIGTHVSFEEVLDVKQYIHPRHVSDPYNRDTKYDLCSIVKHMGNTGGGHYISYSKHTATGKWYKFDDSRVEQIAPEKVAEQQAYLLFYTRRKQDRTAIKSIANTLSVAQQLESGKTKQSGSRPQVLLSRYWLHRVQAFSRPGPIDNLWMSCYHGFPLDKHHERRRNCSIKIPYNTWLELSKKYGLQYNAQMLEDCTDDDDDEEEEQQPNENGNKKENKMDTDDGDEQSSHVNGDEESDVVMVEKNGKPTESDKKKSASLLKKPLHELNSNYHAPWELSEKSVECDDCKLEELVRRREYEKAEIRRLEDDQCPQDCALNMKWANHWRNFVHNKTNKIPGMIDNRHIHDGNHALKSELIKDTDYLMIPSNIWTFLIEIYGGGPKIVPIKRTRRPIKHAPKPPTAQQSPPKAKRATPKQSGD